MRTRAQSYRFAVLRPASDDALIKTLRAAFASSTYLLSQIHGPGRSSDDDLLIPLIPFSRGTSLPSGFPSPHGFPCSPTPARHLMMPCSALEGGACEAGGPGPHGGFLLLGMITSVSGNFRHITDKTSTKNLRIVNKRFKNRIKHLKIVKILIG